MLSEIPGPSGWRATCLWARLHDANFSFTPDLGLGQLRNADTEAVAKLSPEGKILWNHTWEDSGETRVAADACGNVFVARTPVSTVTMGVNASKQTSRQVAKAARLPSAERLRTPLEVTGQIAENAWVGSIM